MSGEEDRPQGAIRTGDHAVVEIAGREVEVIIRSVQTRGQPDKLSGSFGFSVPTENEMNPPLPGMEDGE